MVNLYTNKKFKSKMNSGVFKPGKQAHGLNLFPLIER